MVFEYLQGLTFLSANVCVLTCIESRIGNNYYTFCLPIQGDNPRALVACTRRQSTSFCRLYEEMVHGLWLSIWGDSPRAPVSKLSPVQSDKPWYDHVIPVWNILLCWSLLYMVILYKSPILYNFCSVCNYTSIQFISLPYSS